MFVRKTRLAVESLNSPFCLYSQAFSSYVDFNCSKTVVSPGSDSLSKMARDSLVLGSIQMTKLALIPGNLLEVGFSSKS